MMSRMMMLTPALADNFLRAASDFQLETSLVRFFEQQRP
jgi:hypothetical protein